MSQLSLRSSEWSAESSSLIIKAFFFLLSYLVYNQIWLNLVEERSSVWLLHQSQNWQIKMKPWLQPCLQYQNHTHNPNAAFLQHKRNKNTVPPPPPTTTFLQVKLEPSYFTSISKWRGALQVLLRCQMFCSPSTHEAKSLKKLFHILCPKKFSSWNYITSRKGEFFGTCLNFQSII